MKKFVKSILALTLVLAITFAFVGCKIVILEGKWTATEMTIEAYVYADESQEKVVMETKVDLVNAGAKFVVEVKEDGKGHVVFSLPEDTGFVPVENNLDKDITWSEKDGNITINFGDETLELENNNTGKLVFQQTEESPDKMTKTVVKMTFTRSK